jgi:hypothetical protein
MAKLAVYYKPVVTHLSDETNGRTLCGITLTRDWEVGGVVWEDESSALCGCVKCQHIAEKRADKAAGEGGERG